MFHLLTIVRASLLIPETKIIMPLYIRSGLDSDDRTTLWYFLLSVCETQRQNDANPSNEVSEPCQSYQIVLAVLVM